MKPLNCPVLARIERVIQLGAELAEAMRQLRESMERCERCDVFADCPVWQDFNKMVDRAIQEVNEQWGLTSMKGSRGA